MRIVETETQSYPRIAKFITICAALVLGAYGLLGVVATSLVILLSCIGYFLHITGRFRFVAAGPIKLWGVIVVTYLLVGMGGIILHHEPGDSFGNSFNRLSFLTFLPLTAALFLPPVKDLYHGVKYGAGIGSLVVFIGALLEFVFIRDRVWLGAGNQGPFSVVSAVGFTLCFFAALEGKTVKEQLFFAVATMAAIMCILLSGMRNMMPALLIVPLIAIAILGTQRRRAISKRMGIGIILVVGCLIFLAGWFILPRFEVLLLNWEKASLAQDYDTSLGRRIVMYDYALQAIPSHPWVGIGYQEMKAGLNDFAVSNYGFELGKTHLHNFALTALVQGGVVELASLVALILAPLLLLKGKNKDAMSRFGIAFMVAVSLIYLLSGSLNIMFNHDVMDMMYITCAAFSITLVFRTRAEE